MQKNSIKEISMSKINLEKLKYCFSEHATEEDYNQLRSKILDYNFNHIGKYETQKYFFAYYNGNEELVAGLYANCKLGMFFIDLLWVDELLRKQKLGTRLIQLAEECARKVNALYMTLNTTTFQSLEFYQKQGFKEFAKFPLKIANSKMQHYHYYLIKHL